MKYALKLSNDNRVLFWLRVYPDGNYDGMTMVDTVPDGYINDYLYIDGEYIYDPLPEPEQPDPAPSLESRVATVESDVANLTAAIEKGLAL